MEKELQILTKIDENKNITQRQLAQLTGLSLGSINALLQKLIHKGLIEVRHLNPRTVIYKLTVTGINVKAETLYYHIVDSYSVISKVRMKVKRIIEEQIDKGVTIFYLYGSKDELYKLLKMSLIEAKRIHGIEYRHTNNCDLDILVNKIIFIWDNNVEEILKSKLTTNYINILKHRVSLKD